MCRIFATYLAPNVSELYDSTDMAFPEIILRICGRKTTESISMLRLGVKYANVVLALSTSSRNHLAAARLLRLVSKLHGTRDLLFRLEEWNLILVPLWVRSVTTTPVFACDSIPIRCSRVDNTNDK